MVRFFISRWIKFGPKLETILYYLYSVYIRYEREVLLALNMRLNFASINMISNYLLEMLELKFVDEFLCKLSHLYPFCHFSVPKKNLNVSELHYLGNKGKK